MVRIPFHVVVLAFLSVAPAAWGGWVVTYQEEGSNKTEQVFIESGKLAASDMIVTPEAVIVIGRKSKKYWRGGADEICSTMKKMVDEMMAAMPPGMKERMAKAVGPGATREELGAAEIAGYQAQGYRFLMGGRPVSEIWVSRDPKLAGLLREAKQAGLLAEKVSGCMKSLGAAMTTGGDVSQTKVYEEALADGWVMKEPTGVSMHMTTRGGGQGSMKLRFRTVTSIEQKDVPDSAFEPPAGFEQVASFQELMEGM